MVTHLQKSYLLQVVTMAWDKSKRGMGCHWPSTSIRVARKVKKKKNIVCRNMLWYVIWGRRRVLSTHRWW